MKDKGAKKKKKKSPMAAVDLRGLVNLGCEGRVIPDGGDNPASLLFASTASLPAECVCQRLR